MPSATRTYLHLFMALAAGCALVGCGGGGGGGNAMAGPPTSPPTGGWVSGSFLPATSFAGRCMNPRSGTDPNTGQPYNEVLGTATDENNWLRSWSSDLYLWYNEIVDTNPGLYPAPTDYFALLKTNALTPSGRTKDRFHFTYPTEQWLQLSQSGVEVGYGIAWAVVANTPPRRVVVAYVEPFSPAWNITPQVTRGEEVQTVDGVDLINSNTVAEINQFVAGLYPSSASESHTLTTRDPFGNVRTRTLQSAAVTKKPVDWLLQYTPTGLVGKITFNDHIPPAEQQLVDAISTLRMWEVKDLILDLRYNGGGLLSIASQLAYMIAGPTATAGQTFEKITFNDKHPAIDPVTGDALTPVPFFSTTRGYSTTAGQPLPTLDLPRVFVITGGSTCSASESVINALRGINVDVIQIGSTTCGKPYGFYPADHCGTTYFSVQMKGVNAQGFGDYTDGFSPSNAPGVGGTRIKGCSVADDFNFDLRNANEARFSAALQYRDTGVCPTATGNKPGPLSAAPHEMADAIVVKSLWLQNRWIDRP